MGNLDARLRGVLEGSLRSGKVTHDSFVTSDAQDPDKATGLVSGHADTSHGGTGSPRCANAMSIAAQMVAGVSPNGDSG